MTDAESHDEPGLLRNQIERLETQLQDLRSELTELKLDQWRGRIEDLEVQTRLAALDTRDKLDPMIEGLRNKWLDAREKVTSGASTTADSLNTLKNGLEDAFGVLRDAVADAKPQTKD